MTTTGGINGNNRSGRGRGRGIQKYFGSNKYNGLTDGIRGQREAAKAIGKDQGTTADVSDTETATQKEEQYSIDTQGEQGRGDKTRDTETDEKTATEEDTEGYHTASESSKPKRWADEGWSDDEDIENELKELQAAVKETENESDKASYKTGSGNRRGKNDNEMDDGESSDESEGTKQWYAEKKKQWAEKKRNRTVQTARNTVSLIDEEVDDIAGGIKDVSMKNAAEVTPGKGKRKQEAIKTKQKVSPLNKSPRKSSAEEMVKKNAADEERSTADKNRSRKEDMTMREDTPPKTNRLSDPYKKNVIPDDTGANYIQAVTGEGGQNRIRTHEKVKEKYETVFEVAFDVPRNFPQNPTERDEAEIMTKTLDAIGQRAKVVDRKAKINPCAEKTDAPTISRIYDIPVRHHELANYIKHM